MSKVSPSPLVSLEPALEALRLASAIRTSRLVLLTMFVPAVVMIGPEGGFTEAEVGLAESAGWHRVSLGSRILRIETAALALASAVIAACDEPPADNQP